AHELIEMNSRSGDERARSPSALHHAFVFEAGQCVACRHQAYAMHSCQFALGVDRIARLQLAGFNLLTDRPLNTLIRRRSVMVVRTHEASIPSVLISQPLVHHQRRLRQVARQWRGASTSDIEPIHIADDTLSTNSHGGGKGP